ncbi:helix-turn-helix domain-containing protein [Mycobacterium marinum]|uniref:helix-turn-helix domain-containing protein n=1 Tax=Mycobacterium marinum TaxID=1781 RepID=UPI00235A4314|nr:helix-turn-helix transcriptional regulator [Mycobacterium marinum]MDC8973982.1 helix-turn-helix transcriptional regulator [Mycobacterium marinum]
MAGREPDYGATAATVATNVKRLRENKNLSYTQVSDRLRQIAGWSINAVGVRRIEAGERRVNVDDLMSLAVAFGVSPLTLLMPKAQNSDNSVEITGVADEPLQAGRLWNWLVGRLPLVGETAEEALDFLVRSVPGWLLTKGEVSVAESGLEPNVTLSVRWSGGEYILKRSTSGDD